MALPLPTDHLVYATPSLSRGIDEIEQLTGVRATPGGQHQGIGTRNALLALGPKAYFEIIAPDPEQPAPRSSRPFGLDDLQQSRLVTWAVESRHLERLRSEAARSGIKLGELIELTRRRPDGVMLSFRFTSFWTVVADGIVPFFIDWKQSPHPAESAARGLTLIELRAEHPDAQRVTGMIRALGLTLPVRQGLKPALIATFDSPRGRVELGGSSG